jgi:hypothetical protein
LAVEDVHRTVMTVTVLGLAMTLVVLWLADLRRSKAPILQASAAFLLGTLLFVCHLAIAISADRALFRWAGVMGAWIAALSAYRLSVTSQRCVREGSWCSDVRIRQLAILATWLVIGGPVLTAVGQ